MPSASLISGMVRAPPSPCRAIRSRQRNPYSSWEVSFIVHLVWTISDGPGLEGVAQPSSANIPLFASEHAELQPGCLRHLARVPNRLPHDINLDVAHARNRLDLLPYLDRQRARDRTVRRSEGHLDVNLARGLHSDVVDQPELVNVHRNLGIITGAQHVNDLVV